MLREHLGLFTDYYEFTMAQAYLLSGKAKTSSCFDYFFRENPFGGGYVIFAGLGDLLDALQSFSFDAEEIKFFRKLGFEKRFLEYLKKFHFRGTIHSVREGEVVFPLEPILRVEGDLIEAQIIETLLLNILNFESLIATKASRLKLIAGGRRVVDFGLRRAQGLGGIHASKAAMIGGIDATSNVYAAYHYDLEVTGTQAHSWIQSFHDELAAFRKFAEIFPDRCILLVDTYNTLRSGVPNAITVGKEMERKGHRLAGIRLDSGDLAYLSKHARAMLDEAGLRYVRIVASNQLDEYVIRSLLNQGAPIDVFGVGTALVTGQQTPALDGVYKMNMCAGKPRLKFSENFAKVSLPGIKKVVRYENDEGVFYADGIALDDEKAFDSIFHPLFPENRSSVKQYSHHPLLRKAMERGKPLMTPTIIESAQYAKERLEMLSAEHKRFENPHVYKVGISEKLMNLRSHVIDEFQKTLPIGGSSR